MIPNRWTFLLVCFFTSSAIANTQEHLEFFESKVRPLLIKRCYRCHSADAKKVRGGLRLDSKATILKGGDSGAVIVSGDPDKSLLIQSIRYQSTTEMPPNGKLKDGEIAILTKWVELGAPWPNDQVNNSTNKSGYDWEIARKHWAWQPVKKPELPSVVGEYRVENPIDLFVTAKLSQASIKQSPIAHTAILVRRVYLDLLGLPPSVDALQRWVKLIDANESAIHELIDSLLAQPQYGERWGRHWLDVARYSDTGGWSQDNKSSPKAYHYRDWVVNSFNADMPYHEFVKRQIIGDLLDRNAAIGTGFFALGPSYKSDGGDPESIAQAKSETLDDRVDTFSRAFLGLTLACARCHDHKFDPIPTQDYYSIAGIFNNTREGDRPLVDDQVVKVFNDHQRSIKDLNNKINQAKKKPNAIDQQQIDQWQKELAKIRATAPPKYDFAHTIHEAGNRDMKVALRGNLLKPGEVAPRRFLRILQGNDREVFKEGSGRKQLAEAVIDPKNPLTARVIVNRVWLHHFGKALVRSPSNFGTLGEKPTHPELLDWLTATFIESGWSLKKLHRLIMTSATYRSSSQFRSESFDKDGDNRHLWRMNPRRMDVETWRDSLLVVTGELNSTLGGPSIDNIVNSPRRTIYSRISRNNPLVSDQFLRLFDFPIPRGSASKRTTNVVPQQFLFMMNSPFMLNRARAFAKRIEETAKDLNIQIEWAYLSLYGRRPTSRELQVAKDYLQSESSSTQGLNRWQQYCQVLLSANEFMYIR